MVVEQAHARLAEGILALVILDADHRRVLRSLPTDRHARGSTCSRSVPGMAPPITARHLGRRAIRGAVMPRPHHVSIQVRPGRRRAAALRKSLAVLVRIQMWSRLACSSYQLMPRSAVANTSRNLSPTRSTIAWKSSSAASPCWIAVDDREFGVALFETGVGRSAAPPSALRPSAPGPATIARCPARPRPGSRACRAGRGRIRANVRRRRRYRRRG